MSEMSHPSLSVSRHDFGQTADGQSVDRYRLTNRTGMIVDIVTHGARLHAIYTPDKDGRLDDVTLGFDDIAGYEQPGQSYFGATIGRYGNRIAGASFEIDGHTHRLSANEGQTTLHGGERGFDRRVWAAAAIDDGETVGVELVYASPDGEMGFPGQLTVTLRYTLDNANNLRLHHSAIADATTVVNLTNHAYFNLAGANAESIVDHIAFIHADRYTAIDDTALPTGESPVTEGTVMDFTSPKAIGRDIDDSALANLGGYDHNWILNGTADLSRLAARVIEPRFGRCLELYTTEPGVQFYTGNGLAETATGKHGRAHRRHAAFTLETQHYPDSPNQPAFPSTVLRPGQLYTQTTIYRFSPT